VSTTRFYNAFTGELLFVDLGLSNLDEGDSFAPELTGPGLKTLARREFTVTDKTYYENVQETEYQVRPCDNDE